MYNDIPSIMTFNECKNLNSIEIPSSVKSIGNNAFWFYVRSLETVYYQGTKSEWEEIFDCDENEHLSLATIFYYSETEPTAEGNYWYYDLNGEVQTW